MFLQINEIEIWFDDPDVFLHHDTSAPCDQPYSDILRLYTMFLFMWQNLFRVSDTGISILFSFMATFFLLLSKLLPPLKAFSDTLPKNIDAARRFLGKNKDNFSKWVSCEKCSCLYTLEDAKIKLRNGQVVSKKCGYVRYKNHPQRQHRKPCGHLLMKSIRTSSGTVTQYPRALYCYKSLISSLRDMLQRPLFFQKCEQWRNLQSGIGIYHDIYDGKVWKDFMFVNGSPFLALPYNYALTLNVDWFQPFKRSTYSAGVLYLAIQNLPRTERYLTENIILCGVIPGPKEPEKTVNSFLEPLVHELQLLWKGVQITTNHGAVLVRAALTCVACDIPAARKVCGFVGHNARLACSKCSKIFPTSAFGEKPDYSGFDRTAWVGRSLDDHRKYCAKHKVSNTQSAQVSLEREHGCRYSVLLELSYFDPIRMTIVDPMHNLLLGTAKHIFTIWSDLQLIGPQELKVIQDSVDNFVTPGDIGRIPGKIASGFSGFTADQWRNWTTIFSLSSLKNVLPAQHFECWQRFVKACHLYCRRKITSQELADADLLLESFCKGFEQLYGKERCNINLHLHGHLRECVLDYGPVYSFWLFSFERLNGIMESFSTNCRDVSLQLMRRFESVHQSGIAMWPEEFREDFAPLLDKTKYNKGSLMQSFLEFTDPLIPSAKICALPPLTESSFEPHHFNELRRMFRCSNLLSHEDYTISPLFSKCTAIKVGDYILSSRKSRFVTCSHVMAMQLHRPDVSLAELQYFLKCNLSVTVDGKSSCQSFWLAVASFYYPHACKAWFGQPTEVWSAVTSPDSHFLPLSYIKSRVAYSKQMYNFGSPIGTDSILVVTPLALHN